MTVSGLVPFARGLRAQIYVQHKVGVDWTSATGIELWRRPEDASPLTRSTATTDYKDDDDGDDESDDVIDEGDNSDDDYDNDDQAYDDCNCNGYGDASHDSH